MARTCDRQQSAMSSRERRLEQVVHGLMQRGLQPDGDQRVVLAPVQKEEENEEGQPVLTAGDSDKTVQKEV